VRQFAHQTRVVSAVLMAIMLSLPVFAQKKANAKPVARTIAVLELEGSGISKGEIKTLSEALRAEILKLNAYSVMERGRMDDILKEQGFQQAGVCDNSACMVEIGQLLGVDAMIAGSIGKLGSTYSLALRMFHVGTGKILKSASKYYKGEIDNLLTAVLPVVAQDICGLKPQATVSDDNTEVAEEKGNNTWLYVTVGAAVLGGAGALLMMQGDDGEGSTTGPGDKPSGDRPSFPSTPKRWEE
jgi:hypothetical protein